MANQPSPPTAQPPPDVPAMTDVSDTLSQYLRRFSLWCRNGFADKLSSTAALPGIKFLAYNPPANVLPNTWLLEVGQAGGLWAAPVAPGGAVGTPIVVAFPATSTNDNAVAGIVGEVISSNVVGPGVTLTNSTDATVTSIALTAGDWDVCGEAWIVTGTGGATVLIGSINNVNARSATSALNTARNSIFATIAAGNTCVLPLRSCRVSLAASATYYLVATAFFPSGTCTAYGNIIARRAR